MTVDGRPVPAEADRGRMRAERFGPPSPLIPRDERHEVGEEAGAVTINHGVFVNAVISFVIVAFAVFLVVRSFNRMKRKEEVDEAPAPPGPSAEEKRLAEIRDLLKARA